ncbi:MAG TPA: hypothetical protein H9774_03195 [Candidatus Desulfovibrio gallistercoris]|nr:hypothetical protein [Candidatus Desulfovibrio gallistercoris]
MKRFAFQTIRSVVLRKKRGFSAHFGPGDAALPPCLFQRQNALAVIQANFQAKEKAGLFVLKLRDGSQGKKSEGYAEGVDTMWAPPNFFRHKNKKGRDMQKHVTS